MKVASSFQRTHSIHSTYLPSSLQASPMGQQKCWPKHRGSLQPDSRCKLWDSSLRRLGPWLFWESSKFARNKVCQKSHTLGRADNDCHVLTTTRVWSYPAVCWKKVRARQRWGVAFPMVTSRDTDSRSNLIYHYIQRNHYRRHLDVIEACHRLRVRWSCQTLSQYRASEEESRSRRHSLASATHMFTLQEPRGKCCWRWK